MANIIFITGGSRSGKSDFALTKAREFTGSKAFIATCPVTDDEMAERIRKHQFQRSPDEWVTIEEQTYLAAALIGTYEHQLRVVDCLTLWINNLFHTLSAKGEYLSEEDIADECEGILDACRPLPGGVIMVSNEVGWGIVPADPAVRLYRDLVGRCNQTMAAAAAEAYLVCCGYPFKLK